MKMSTILRRAARDPQLGTTGCCITIQRAGNYTQVAYRASDFFESWFSPGWPQPYWMGPLTPENLGVRQTALLLAAELAEDEGS